MHPVIARFLSLPSAIATLEKQAESPVDAEEAALRQAAAALPKARSALLEAKAARSPSPRVQQQLIVLATRAATLRVVGDPALGPRAAAAKAALLAEGATAEEADDLVAQAVLEEAFGYAEDPETFDADFLGETLDALAQLARVTQERLDDWLERFARGGNVADRALRLAVAEALLDAAWGEGPQPITPEHLDDALEHLGDTVAATEFGKAAKTVGELLAFLAEAQLIGPQRLARLQQVLTTAAAGGGREPVEGEDDGEQDEA